jgi:hypothetical protein
MRDITLTVKSTVRIKRRLSGGGVSPRIGRLMDTTRLGPGSRKHHVGHRGAAAPKAFAGNREETVKPYSTLTQKSRQPKTRSAAMNESNIGDATPRVTVT